MNFHDTLITKSFYYGRAIVFITHIIIYFKAHLD